MLNPDPDLDFFTDKRIPDLGVKRHRIPRSRIRNTGRNHSIRLWIQLGRIISVQKATRKNFKAFRRQYEICVKLLMIILLKLSKKVGFGSKKQYPQDPARPKRFRFRLDPEQQRPDHTTIQISQQNEDHNNRHWATIVEKLINN